MRPRKILVAGSVAQRRGYGGHAWVFLQYLLGLRDLGYDVLFVDRLLPSGDPHTDAANAHYLEEQAAMLGERIPIAVLGWDGLGLVSAEDAVRFARGADAVFNVMGFLDDDQLLDAPAQRVFLDIDPGFGQMWKALDLADVFGGHDIHVTVGQNVGRPSCSVPSVGIDWIPTLPPVVLRHWPPSQGKGRSFTTVASWRGPFGPVEYQGRMYGLRVHEFRRFVPLPGVTDTAFELAMDIDDSDQEDVDAMAAAGWRLVEPRGVAGDVISYRDYVRRSQAEFMVAKNMYAATSSGWVSDRSVCYLASARPVLAQDTGLREQFPDGEGLVLFSDLDEAAAGVRAITQDYPRHSAAARRLAEQHFDAAVVLPRLLRRVGLVSA